MIEAVGDLRNEARFITLSMKRPSFLVFGLMSDPNTMLCNTHANNTLSINARVALMTFHHISNACIACLEAKASKQVKSITQ